MPKSVARTEFVTMTHAKTKAEGQVPLSAVKHYEAHGWKTVTEQPRPAEPVAGAPDAPAEADETAEAESKKKTTSK